MLQFYEVGTSTLMKRTNTLIKCKERNGRGYINTRSKVMLKEMAMFNIFVRCAAYTIIMSTVDLLWLSMDQFVLFCLIFMDFATIVRYGLLGN